MSCSASNATKGAVIVARHGERIDYVLRDSKRNWIPTAPRPWDPPLTSRGRMQARKLGTYLSKLLTEKGLGPVAAVYSSPMVRCCQTAAEAVIGLTGGEGVGGESSLKVKVEPGLVESLNEKWYRSWCLADSNGTWGGRHPATSASRAKDEEDIDPRAKLAAHSLVWGPHEIADFLSDEMSSSQLEESDDTKEIHARFVKNDYLAALIDVDTVETDAIYNLQDKPYKYNIFESPESGEDRMEVVARSLSEKHPNQTVLLLSHGEPVTHVYKRLTGNDMQGMATYTSFSVYKPNEDGDKWEALVSNESCHVKDIESADHNSSFI